MTKGVEARRLTGDVKGRCEGHSGFCSHLQVHQDSSTQTEPPAFGDTSASTADEYTTVSEPTPTQIDPPPPVHQEKEKGYVVFSLYILSLLLCQYVQ